MDPVFLLHHVHSLDDGHEDVKLLGVFSTFDLAQRALDRASELQGFRDSPDAFSIDKYIVDKMQWTSGYRTV